MTDDFGYANITSSIPYHPEWDVGATTEQLETAKAILDQPFTYLASGSQSYVFLSDDGNYVLKFFKHKRWRLSPLLEFFPLPAKLEAKILSWKEKKNETVHSTFGSCITSYQIFPKETATLFVHLNKSPLDQTIVLKDRIGFKHHIELSDVEFVLQKRAIPTDYYLLSLKEEGKTETAKEALASILAFTYHRAQKGYSDKDPHPIRNFGFIEGEAVEIDIGGFYRDPKKDLTYYQTHEILRIERNLLTWLEKNYPALLPAAYEELARLKK